VQKLKCVFLPTAIKILNTSKKSDYVQRANEKQIAIYGGKGASKREAQAKEMHIPA